jgi:hypothetical protein
VRRRGRRILLGDNTIGGTVMLLQIRRLQCVGIWISGGLPCTSIYEVILKSPYTGKMVSLLTKPALYVYPARVMISIRYSLNKDISEKKNTFNSYQYGEF